MRVSKKQLNGGKKILSTNEKIFLTGSTGFVGSHLLRAMLKENYDIHICIRKESDLFKIMDIKDQVSLTLLDLSNRDAVNEYFKKHRFDTVIYCAWQGVSGDFRNDLGQFDNLLFISNLFEISRKTGTKKWIGFGSQAEYAAHTSSIDETYKTEPTTLYGISKLSVYHMLKILSTEYEISFSWIRIFSCYGPYDNEKTFIPYMIKNILLNNSLELTKGEQLWDFLYIDDLTSGIISVLKNNIDGVINLGSGKTVQISDVAKIIKDMINDDYELNFGTKEYRHDQVMYLHADISKLKNMCSWTPKWSLEKGIKNTIEFIKDQTKTNI